MRILLVLFIVLNSFCAFSQREKASLPVISLRLTPTSFLESDAGAMLGVGVQVAPRWELTFEPMLILYTPLEAGEEYEERNAVNGYKLRSGIKYYLRDYEYGGKPKLFFAIEWHYKEVTEKKWETFGMNLVNGQYAFFQRARYDEKRKENGGIVKAGFVTRLWSPRLTVELFAGLGLREKVAGKQTYQWEESFSAIPTLIALSV